MKFITKIFVAVAAFLVLITAKGCLASDWPTQYSNNQNNPVVFDTFKEGNTVNSIDLGSMTAGPSIISGGGLLFSTSGSSSKSISAYDFAGQLVWQKSFSVQVLNLIYDSEKVYFASDEFYALDAATGEIIWKSSICGGKSCKALRQDNGIIYGYKSTSLPYAHIVSIDVTTGFLRAENLANPITTATDLVIGKDGLYFMVQSLSSANTSVIKLSKYDLSLVHQFSSCPVRAYGGLLDEEYQKLYLSADGRLCTYDLASLSSSVLYNSGTYGGFAKYGNAIYEKGSYSLTSFGANESTPTPKYFQTVGMQISSNPLVVNGVIYFGTTAGKVWGYNLGTGQQKTWDFETGSAISNFEYANGKFIVTSRIGNEYKIIITDLDNLSLQKTTFPIVINSPYQTEGMNQYLGQTHCHYIPDVPLWSKIWNGLPSPLYTINSYEEKGYNFVALTEHNQIVPMPVADGILQIQNSEESTQPYFKHHLLAIGINSAIDDSAADQIRINAINAQNGIAIMSHPDSWIYGALSTTIGRLSGLKFIEIFNRSTQAYSLMTQGYAFDDFDYLLTKRGNKFLTAGDDYTPGDGFIDGGAISVFATDNTQQEIINAIKAGNFYALEGSGAPRINNISVETQTIQISVSETSDITFIGKDGIKLKTEKNVTNSIYSIQGNEIFVRMDVESSLTGKHAWSQPILISKEQHNITIGGGAHSTTLDKMVLNSNATDLVSASALPTSQGPESTPPAGYLSPVYELTTAGILNPGNQLSINYSGETIPVKENNLSIFSYDELNNVWQPISSIVDLTNHSVSANLSHFSLYTLSATLPEDTQAPEILLNNPEELLNPTDKVTLAVTAKDNQAVIKINLSIDGKFIASDINGSDGWYLSFDAKNLINGSHTIVLTAQDYAGNIGKAEYGFLSTNGIYQPTISIINPLANQYLWNSSNLSGNYSSQKKVDGIRIYLDDVFIEDAEIDSQSLTFSKNINWTNFNQGEHVLKSELTDIDGNVISEQIDVTVGEEKISFDEIRQTINKLESDGHIKNHGIAQSIISRLNIAERFENNFAIFTLTLEHLKSFIIQQSQGTKAKIDESTMFLLFQQLNIRSSDLITKIDLQSTILLATRPYKYRSLL